MKLLNQCLEDVFNQWERLFTSLFVFIFLSIKYICPVKTSGLDFLFIESYSLYLLFSLYYYLRNFLIIFSKWYSTWQMSTSVCLDTSRSHYVFISFTVKPHLLLVRFVITPVSVLSFMITWFIEFQNKLIYFNKTLKPLIS